MSGENYYSKRNLPHYYNSDYPIFFTFRLVESYPVHLLLELRKEFEKELSENKNKYKDFGKNQFAKLEKEYFERFDSDLDRCVYGNNWLSDRRVADCLFEHLKSFDGIYYDLYSFTIMPNHVHIILKFIPDDKSFAVEKELKLSTPARLNYYSRILMKLKGGSAFKCNKILGRTGPFWQVESYDHIINDNDELKNVINYIKNNPVKAGLCNPDQKWPHFYVNYDLLDY
ncbi:MAG: transposase [Ignavibacteriaceae bacterium]|nr:transposase [Ignavibacteriaceae bacterium]NUM70054.1 transposase [Ignavibacteriaceae bacterium]